MTAKPVPPERVAEIFHLGRIIGDVFAAHQCDSEMINSVLCYLLAEMVYMHGDQTAAMLAINKALMKNLEALTTMRKTAGHA